MKQMELDLGKDEMEEQKARFFTNMSHDIMTPLTMVMAPLEKLRGIDLPPDVRTEVDTAWQNAQQLYDLVTCIEIRPSEMTVSSLDAEFIERIIADIEANMADPSYSVVQLSSSVGMTRGNLYKKLMAIVGKSPVEFIRIVRLKRGRSLLDQGRTNISEVADRVGFSPKMFAHYFKEMYGETPSEYLKKRK